MYNVGGNIVSKTEYAYTTGTVGTAIKTYNYTYGNTWKDQLTAFDGTAITYDAAGNPASYLGKTLTWSRGRLLTKYVSGSKTVDMQYDAKGIRIGKTRKVVSTTTNCTYIYDNGGKLRTEIDGNTTRNYIYGQDGVVGYEENGVHFMYRKNFFGDITAIYQGATKIAEYNYDAWGNCTVVSDYNGYGARNPFRYRGYYFDSDLNMYYLMTRYYDPQIGRFINADSYKYLAPDSINGLNLYAYCLNNPIMYVDPYGHDWKSFWKDVWNFIVEWYKQVAAVNQQIASTNNDVIIKQNEIASDTIITIAEHNMVAQSQTTTSEQTMKKNVNYLLVIKTGEAFEWAIPKIFPNPSSDDVERIAGALVGAAGSPHEYDISGRHPDIVNVSWE